MMSDTLNMVDRDLVDILAYLETYPANMTWDMGCNQTCILAEYARRSVRWRHFSIHSVHSGYTCAWVRLTFGTKILYRFGDGLRLALRGTSGPLTTQTIHKLCLKQLPWHKRLLYKFGLIKGRIY